MKGLAIGSILSALICSVALVVPLAPASASTDPGADQRDPWEFMLWSLRPDGGEAAYVIGKNVLDVDGSQAKLVVQNVRTGSSTVIKDLKDHVLKRGEINDISPTWSPDGSALAYLAPDRGVWHLHVYHRTTGSEIIASREAALHSGGCTVGIAWSPDSHTIYFLAKPTKATPDSQSGLVDNKVMAQAPQVTPGMHLFEHRPASGPNKNALVENCAEDIVSVDAKTARLNTVLTGKSVVRIYASPDGKFILAGLRSKTDPVVRQAYFSWAFIPVGNADLSNKLATSNSILRDTPFQWASWAPSSGKVAFQAAGALSTGDISVFDLVSGKLTDVTARPLPLEKGEVLRQMPLSDRAFNLSKFHSGLGWAPSSDAIYAIRRTEFQDHWATRLWRFDLYGSEANLTAGAPFDVVRVPFENPGWSTNGAVTVPIKEENDAIGFVSLDDKFHSPHLLATLNGKFVVQDDNVSAASTSDVALLVRETAQDPQEVFVFDKNSDSFRQLSRVNAGVAGAAVAYARKLVWRTPSGEHFGYLYLPKTSGHPPPLIVQLYPRQPDEAPLDGSAYAGHPRTFLKPLSLLLRRGFAILKPDIPVAGGAQSCQDVADNAVAALDAIKKANLADTGRAAVIGHSFGGWAVGCVIAHTNRFKAAISVAGISDLESLSFSIVSGPSNLGYGGGQALLGKSIWESPLLFWTQSPIAWLPHVETPLLLFHGEADPTVPVTQSEEMYSGLARLGKEVSLVTYVDADHGSVLDNPDYIRRLSKFLSDHLETRAPSAQHSAD